MSVTDVTSRIQQIQAQLSLLGPPSSSTASGAAFTASLDQASATPAGDTGERVVAEAKKYLGVPYVWGGTDPARGLDCSGLVQLVYRNLGYELPRVSRQQAQAGVEVEGGLSRARAGDLVAFGSPVHHIGIYVGNGMMIEAPRPGKDVRLAEVSETPTHVRRILPTGAPEATPAAGSSGFSGFSGEISGVPYAELFNAASSKYGVPAALLSAVAKQESGYNPRAVSPAGAQGLMQLMPGTARGLGVTNSFDPAQAVDGAARMLRDLIMRFGSIELGLAGYNAGPGAVIKYDGIPPYRETQHYVANVMALMEAAA